MCFTMQSNQCEFDKMEIRRMADNLFERYLQDWGDVTLYRMSGGAGYPSTSRNGRQSSPTGGLPQIGQRFIDVERCLDAGGIVRMMAHRMYVGTGCTVERYVRERFETSGMDWKMFHQVLPVYSQIWAAWRARSVRNLGLRELVAGTAMPSVAQGQRSTAARPMLTELEEAVRAWKRAGSPKVPQ